MNRMALTPSSLARLEQLLGEATDAELASWNPALWRSAADPALRFHLDPARANAVRALDIPSSARVLEIGAGAGAVTRYLGESSAAVDAVEPDPDLARLLRMRVRGLPHVGVHADLDALEADARYDVVVALDTLRHTAPDRRAETLDRLAGLLAPSGVLVLGESNALGAKYLVGSPDDETGRPFDSVEGYPAGASHPALTRRELTRLLADAGLAPDFLPALPDHHFGRTVVDSSALPDDLRHLAADLTVLPSPDLGAPRPRLADEREVWPRLVEAGLDIEHANSWLVLARAGTAPVAPLGPGVLAAFDSWQRSDRYTAHSRVVLDEAGLRVDRTYPHRDPASPFHVEDSSTPYAPGRPLLDELVVADTGDWQGLLERWREAVERLWRTRVWLDVHPGNFIVGPDGALSPIDLEFGGTDADREFGLLRSVLATARSIAVQRAHDTFPPRVETIEQLATHLGSLIGIPRAPRWVARALDAEAAFQAEISGDTDPQAVRLQRAALREQFRTRLDALAVSARDYEVVERVIAERDASFVRAGELDARVGELEAEAAAFPARVTELEHRIARAGRKADALSRHIGSLELARDRERAAAQELETELRNVAHHWYLEAERMRVVQESRSVRYAIAARSAVDRALPGGTRRRRVFLALFRRGG